METTVAKEGVHTWCSRQHNGKCGQGVCLSIVDNLNFPMTHCIFHTRVRSGVFKLGGWRDNFFGVLAPSFPCFSAYTQDGRAQFLKKLFGKIVPQTQCHVRVQGEVTTTFLNLTRYFVLEFPPLPRLFLVWTFAQEKFRSAQTFIWDCWSGSSDI